LLFNEPPPDAPDSDLDVYTQVDAVHRALTGLGHECLSMGCTLDLGALRERLVATRIDCVFNLVESLGGTDRLQVLVPMLLDSMNISYTGTNAAAMLASGDKVLVKQGLVTHGLPTAPWFTLAPGSPAFVPGKYIVKARYEHASVGIDDSAVIETCDGVLLADMIRHRWQLSGHEMFAEQFIDGREFNISVLADGAGTGRALVPAEIDFSAYPEGKPRIVGYDAKWSESSFEYNATPRSFAFIATDSTLLSSLQSLSENVWQHFGLGGYARIDYRVDEQGAPYILEINTNPCLSPDAGFAAALDVSNIDFATAMEQIVVDAMRSNSRGEVTGCQQ
ncbi:MAG: hypothetical protein WD558_06260, partial [Pseudomonadales bacterium]